MVDIRLMQAAVAVAEELSFSRAAEKLGTTQSAITKQIQDLEERVGRELFRRNKRMVEVTEAGQAFVEDARKALLYAERAVLSARGRSESAEALLRLGKSPYTDPFLVSTLLSVRLPLYPDLKVNLSSNFSGVLVHNVLNGSIDIALVTAMGETNGLSSVQVASSSLYIALESRDPLAKLRELRLSDLHARHWILFERHVNSQVYDQLQRAALADRVVPLDTQHVISAEEATPLIGHLQGVAFLTRTDAWRIARDGITMRPLTDDRLTLRTYISARAEEDSRVISEFIRAAVRKLNTFTLPKQERLPLAV